MSDLAGVIYSDVISVIPLIHPMLDMMRPDEEKLDIISYKSLEMGMVGGSLHHHPKLRISVAFEGRLTNTSEIKERLSAKGIFNQALPDGMLIALAYPLVGNLLFGMLEGEFSLAILDEDKHAFLLARDRIGKENLYWHLGSRHFLFSSSLKSILATRIVPQTPSTEALASYLYFGFIPQDMSPILQVNKLLPGHFLIIDHQFSLSIHPYWSCSQSFKPFGIEDPKKLIREFHHLLFNGIKSRLSKEREIVCQINDRQSSRTLFSFLKTLAPETKVTPLEVSFEKEKEESFEDPSLVKYVLSPKNIFQDWKKIVWHLEEPIADFKTLITWHLAKHASLHSRYLFTDVGSNPLLFNDYQEVYNYYTPNLWTSSKQKLFSLIKRNIFPLIAQFNISFALKLLHRFRQLPWQTDYLSHVTFLDSQIIQRASPKLFETFDPYLFLNKFHHLGNI